MIHRAISQATAAVSPIASTNNSVLQRKCDCGNHTSTGKGCTGCDKNKAAALQYEAAGTQLTHGGRRTQFGSDFSRIPVHAQLPARSRSEFTATMPGDAHEREADAVAENVMRMPNSITVSAHRHIEAEDRFRRAATGDVAVPGAAPNLDLEPIRRGVTSGRPGLGATNEPLARKPDDVANGLSRLIASRSAAVVMRKGENVVSDTGKSDAMPTGELPGAPAACVVESALPYARSGILRSATGEVGEKFEVRVSWRSDPQITRGNSSYCAAECGEYHQFIKGYMLSSPNQDGSGATDISGKVFGGKPLDKNVFLEDGLDNNPAARYGHRKEKQTMNEDYLPDRATGPRYIGRDFPRVMIGTFADIDVSFVGKLVDTCNNTETTSGPWRVQYRGIIRP